MEKKIPISFSFSKHLMKEELIRGLKTNTCTQEGLNSSSLSEERVDWSTNSKRSLQHVAKQHENGVKRAELGGVLLAHFNSRHELS